MPAPPRSLALACALAAALACVAHPPGESEAPPPEIATATPEPAPPAPAEAAEPEPAPTSDAPLAGDAADAPPPLPDDYLAFAGACDEGGGETVTIAAVGDILLHHELQIQAFAAADRHRNIWRSIEDLLGRADITYGNLEGPMASGVDRSGALVDDPGEVFDRVVYTAYPRFNFHPSVAVDLKKSGFDVVSTANNHALDRQAIGVDRTIEALAAAKLAFTGTHTRAEPDAPWHAVIRRRGLAIAFLACTDLLNVRPDSEGQVLRCKGKAFEGMIRKLAGQKGIDAVIVTPHWGKEYEATPRPAQVELAHRWAEAGATAILGSHPHVLQPWERYTAEDGREVLIHYSLGNFASHQPELPKRSTILLYLGLRRGDDGVVRLRGAGYVPLHVRQEGERFFVEAIDRVAGPADARALIVELHGEGNLLGADDPLELTPHCDPRRRPPEGTAAAAGPD
ncbi:MAG: CapA family protein [Myxococcales bacterium]|nr:CapA family protein [Myxococcales bacterium]